MSALPLAELEFLRGIFPKKTPEELNSAFAWVYERGRFGEEQSAKARENELAGLTGLDRDLVEIWFRGNPRPGGRQVVARLIADAVCLAFEDLGEPVTWGTWPDSNRPSTAFGMVVEDALDFHGSKADWRGVARDVWKRAKSK